jgi:hypothetical protein
LTTASSSTCADAFKACRQAMQRAVLIQRVSRSDKQYRFSAYRVKGMGSGKVSMADIEQIEDQLLLSDEEDQLSLGDEE